MSASDRLRALARGAPWGWIEGRTRALSFLFAFAFVVGLGAWWIPEPNKLLLTMPVGDEVSDAERASQALAAALADDTELVLLIGGSTMRELTPTDRYMSDALSHACGRPLRVVNAGTSSQTLADGWALAEFAAHGRLAAVFVGMNYYRMQEDLVDIAVALERPRVPVPRPTSLARWLSLSQQRLVMSWSPLGDVMQALRAGRPTSRGVVAFGVNVLQAHDSPAAPEPGQFGTPFQHPRNVYRPPVLARAEKRRIASEYLAARLAAYAVSVDDATAAWRGLADHIEDWGARAVFLVLPADPSWRAVDAVLGAPFDAALSEVAGDRHVVLDLRGAVPLGNRHFYDQQHLVAQGRRLLWPRLRQALIDHVPDCLGAQRG